MIQVLFFASIRERVGRSSVALAFDASLARVAQVIDRLDRHEVPGCAAILTQPGALVAVNRTVVDRDHAVRDGDEVAFYPPVTGG
jgi:sulfur-carrier protein